MSVAVVTDSTAHLPAGVAERHSIVVVPLHVLVDGVAVLDGVHIGPDDLVKALRSHRIVTTSRPTPDEFARVFHTALDNGASEVVSVHLSQDISGTWESALLAAQRVDPSRIRVVDSMTTVMGLGFAAIHAARVAAEGGSADDVAAAALATAKRSRTFFVVPTLDYLRRGGRIGTASALVGSALSVKPLLHIEHGHIGMLEKVRTTARAEDRLIELAVQAAGSGEVEIAVHHLAAPERAAAIVERLVSRLPDMSDPVMSELGAVLGAHTGPGVIGVVVQPVGR